MPLVGEQHTRFDDSLARPRTDEVAASRSDGATIGGAVFGASAVALGLVGLGSGEFAAVWQPVPDWLPAPTAFAHLTGLLFVAAGVAILRRRGGAWAPLVLAGLFVVFAIGWVPRVVNHPRILGTYNGVCEQLAAALAAITYYTMRPTIDAESAARARRIARLLFGVCLLSFGATHFDAIQPTADMVPKWLPPGPRFWAVATGVFHISAGVAILTGVWSVLASRLFTAMLITFGLLVWLPTLAANPASHVAWAGNAVNFTLVGAAWLMSDAIARDARRAAVRR